MTAGAFVRKQSKFRGRPEGGPERHTCTSRSRVRGRSGRRSCAPSLGLDALGISYADPYRDERGWAFTGGRFTDDVNGFEFLKEAYLATEPEYDGRISVPVLWDKEEGRIVSNESADIVVFLNEWAGGDLYPEELRGEIDELNEWIYSEFQNGVYRAGFSRTQEAYDEAFRGVFAAMERLEERLQDRRYLAGDGSRSPTGGCSPRCCASTPSTTRTSAATAPSWSSTRTCSATRPTCTGSRTSPRRSRSTRSSATTTRPTTSSTRSGSSPPGRSTSGFTA